jgi:hypothetical protein
LNELVVNPPVEAGESRIFGPRSVQTGTEPRILEGLRPDLRFGAIPRSELLD